MEFTGERYVPSLDGQIKYEHLHRYALCLEFVAGKSVLDIASGEGYGSALLARVAKSVVGVDIIPEVIEYAAQQYNNYKNLRFIVGSCDLIPLPNHSVDVVISFETIEHHDKHQEMMLEIKRVLKPEGILIISSPNRLTYSDEANSSNPFHVKELYYNELVNLLEIHFKYTKIYGQRLATASFVFPLEDTAEQHFKAYKGNLNNLNQQVCSLKSPIYFVAICSDELGRIKTPIDSIYIDESDDLLQVHSQTQLEQKQAELERSQSQLQQKQAELERSQFQLQQTQAELERSQSQLQQTQAALEYSNTTIAAMHTSKFWKLRTLWFKFKERALKSLYRFKNLSILSFQTNTFSPQYQVDQVLPPPPLTKHSVSVDVIICVHNALDDVRNCLESVVRYSSMPYSIILVDDGSNEETCQYLVDFANTQGATLIRNEVAKGYTFAANQGLKKSKADYAILLNSDTIVTPKWLDRIVACGESDPKIGLIGPLSNTASWQSIPEISVNGDWAENKLPLGMTVSYMGKLVADYSRRLYPRIPFLNGFCLAIKRRTIASIGYFDQQTFGAGYGEENDYCLRARKAGWQLAIADDTYIYHSQSRSYSHERRKLLCDRADKALLAKHGQQIISEGVSVCLFDRVIEGVRSRSRVMLSRQKFIEDGKSRWEGKRVLIILPILHPGGGGNVVFQEATAMQKMGVDVRIVNFNHHRPIFEQGYPENNIPIIYVDNEYEIAHLLPQYDAIIATLYKSVYWLQILNQEGKTPVRGYYVQDFEPYFFPEESPEYQIALKSYTQYADLVKFTKTEWNRNVVKTQTKTDCLIIEPSVNLDLYRPFNRRDSNWPQRPLRIAAMIRPDTPRRAAELTMKVLQKVYLTHGNNIQIIIFGCESNDSKFQALTHDFPFYNAGILTCSQLAFLLNEIDIFVDFSTFQAMGLTAMEAMACGAAVIVPEEGGASSFAIHEKNSLIVDTSSYENCFQALNRLISDQELRQKLQQAAINDICQYFPEKAAYKILDSLFTDRSSI